MQTDHVNVVMCSVQGQLQVWYADFGLQVYMPEGLDWTSMHRYVILSVGFRVLH